jgi:hypothetical protein
METLEQNRKKKGWNNLPDDGFVAVIYKPLRVEYKIFLFIYSR